MDEGDSELSISLERVSDSVADQETLYRNSKAKMPSNRNESS